MKNIAVILWQYKSKMVRIVSRTAVIQRYGQITHKQLSTPESFNYKFVYLVITDLLNFLKTNLVF